MDSPKVLQFFGDVQDASLLVFADDLVTSSLFTSEYVFKDITSSLAKDTIEIVSHDPPSLCTHKSDTSPVPAVHSSSSMDTIVCAYSNGILNGVDKDVSTVSCSSDSSEKSPSESSSSSDLTNSSGSSSSNDSDSSSLLSSAETAIFSSSRITIQSKKQNRLFNFRRKTLRRLKKKRKDESYIDFLKEREEFVQREAKRIIDWKRKQRLQKAIRKITQEWDVIKPKANLGITFAQTPSEDHSFDKIPCLKDIPSEINVTPNLTNKSLDREDKSLDCLPLRKPQKFHEVFCRYILFEKYHTMPSIVGTIVYCIAHQSVFEGFGHVFAEIIAITDNQKMIHLHCLILAAGLLLLRISGGVYTFLSNDRWDGLRFDLHNKVRMRDVDANLFRWFKRWKVVKNLLDLVGLYLCLAAVSFFLKDVTLNYLCDIRQKIFDGLPSHDFMDELDEPTEVMQTLEYGSCVINGGNENIMREERKKSPDWSFSDEALSMDEEYLWSSMSAAAFYNLMGYVDAFVYSSTCAVPFYAIVSVVSLLILRKLGLNLFD